MFSGVRALIGAPRQVRQSVHGRPPRACRCALASVVVMDRSTLARERNAAVSADRASAVVSPRARLAQALAHASAGTLVAMSCGMRCTEILAALAVCLSIANAGCGGVDDTPDDETSSESDALSAWTTPAMVHNLRGVNAYRAKKGLKKLVLAKRLSAFAHAGSVELSRDHSAHAHFIAAAKSGAIWRDGFRSSAGENQGDPNGWPAAPENTQIDQILAAMYAEGPGKGEAHGHYENIMDPKFTRLGVGLVEEPNGVLYLTNDFSE